MKTFEENCLVQHLVRIKSEDDSMYFKNFPTSDVTALSSISNEFELNLGAVDIEQRTRRVFCSSDQSHKANANQMIEVHCS